MSDRLDLNDEPDEGLDGDWLDGLRAAGLPVRSDSGPQPATTHVSAAPAALVGESWAPSTRTAYEQSWARFAGWCDATRRLDAWDANENDLADYVAYHVQSGLSPAYLARNLAAITSVFELAGRPSPARHPLVTRAAAGARRVRGTAQRQAEPLRLAELRSIVNGMAIVSNRPPNDPMIRRDRALLLLGWAAAMRASDLVALNVEDLAFTGDPDRGDGGMLLRLHRSKTDQEQRGASIAVTYSQRIGSCPVRSTMLLTREYRTGPLFRRIDRHGRIGGRLSADAVTDIVQRHVANVLTSVDPALFSSHSLRAGFVTELRAQRVAPHLIQRQTRHKDLRTLSSYDRPGNLFDEPALAGEWW